MFSIYNMNSNAAGCLKDVVHICWWLNRGNNVGRDRGYFDTF